MLREIVLDTETTGLDAKNGDRLIELGCIELVNRIPTGAELHYFLNPEGRAVHPDAEAIHGLSGSFLLDKPLFRNVVDEFLDFIGDAPLIIHNASFDVGFINAELTRLGRPSIEMYRVVDTLALARRRHPAGPNSLDALCRRYGIDNSQRTKHGALVDSALLASVYVELLGERQATLELAVNPNQQQRGGANLRLVSRSRPVELPPRLTPADRDAHAAFVETLGANAIWRRYMNGPAETAV